MVASGGPALADTATITAVSPGGTLTPSHPSTIVPVTLSRSSATAMVGFSVEFTVSSGLTVPVDGITNGDVLGFSGLTPEFHVRTLSGAGHYAADGVVLGDATHCGTTATGGTLFTIALTGSGPGASGSVTINSVTLRDCSNATLASTFSGPATVAIDFTAPAVTVVAPNGGETWVAGSTHDLTWTATDAGGFGPGPVSLDLSTDGGASWSPITTGQATSGTYAWTVPAMLSTTARVRATATDVNGNTGQDVGDADFTIGQWVITASAGTNGAISPSGAVGVDNGDSRTFTITPDPGYHVGTLTVDSAAQPVTAGVMTYMFTGVTADHAIAVTFAANPAVTAITTLAAATLRSGNDNSGIARVEVSWPAVPAGCTVHVYRADFGNYPQYDSGSSPGSVPPVPSWEPAGRWSPAGSVASPGTTLDDQPGTRGYWYYVAFVEDAYGTLSPVSNMGGALDYFLADVTNGTPGHGDNRVTTPDISLLGFHYGSTLAVDDPFDYLDIGPTIDHTVSGRPAPDRDLGFEDLVIFAINYNTVSAPQANVRPAATASATDEVLLEAPERVTAASEVSVRLLLHGTGRMQGVSTTLSWDPAVVEPVRTEPGDFVLQQGGVVLSPRPGSVDAAVLGVRDRGLTGEGELATITFRTLTAGDARFAVRSVDARDAANRKVDAATAIRRPAVQVPLMTSLSSAAPNPFRSGTTLAFGLSRAGSAELAVFSVDGRRVRTLASGPREAGNFRAEWNGRDEEGHLSAPGVYYARLVTAQGRFRSKLVLAR